jgi:hypothetical protein
MRKLRIVEKQYSDGTTRYEIQTRLLGFLWWVNVADEDALTRDFHSLDKAKAELPYYADPEIWPKETVVYQNFEDKN